MPGIIANKKPGSNVKLEIWRDGKSRQLTVRPVEIEEDGQRVASTGAKSDAAKQLGLTLRQLTPDEKKQAKTEGNLIVQRVDGPAAAAGVRPGDIILGVNGSPVKSVDELREAAKKRKGKVVALLVQRNHAQIFIPVRLE